MTRRYITPKQIIEAARLFDEYLTVEDCPEGTCRYVNDHDDAWIAKQIEATIDQVARLRVKLKGKLQTRSSPGDHHEKLIELSAVLSEALTILANLAAGMGSSPEAIRLHDLARRATLVEAE